MINKLPYACLLFIVSVLFTHAQTYQDVIHASRQAKTESFIKNPTTPLTVDDVQHLHYYDPDEVYRVEATIELLYHEQPFRMPTSDGTSKEYVRYAKTRFSIGGEVAELTLYKSTDFTFNPALRNHLFLPFTDLTNGEDTYGAGRYIDL